jgi:hypothetical protein
MTANRNSGILWYLGIDPGASGGLTAIRRPVGPPITQSMPATLADAWEWINNFSGVKFPDGVFAVIEQVQGYMGGPDGQKGGGSSNGRAMFTFGQSYGSLLMALTAAGIPFETVTPQRWQRALLIPPRKKKTGETRAAFKNRLKAKAQALFPQLRVTLATADSLLIAEYCRRKRTGTLAC